MILRSDPIWLSGKCKCITIAILATPVLTPVDGVFSGIYQGNSIKPGPHLGPYGMSMQMKWFSDLIIAIFRHTTDN